MFSSDLNTSTPVRLFGQFKPNGFGFNSLTPSTFGQANPKEKSDDQNSSSGYFTTNLSKFSSTSGFGASSTPLAASLASLGANKPLFGGSSTTTPSSFTDLKTPTSKNDDDDGDNDQEKEKGEAEEGEEKSSLLDNVAEYEAKRASTHPAVTIEGDTSTGEENEVTKFQVHTSTCKVICFEGEKYLYRWQENYLCITLINNNLLNVAMVY